MRITAVEVAKERMSEREVREAIDRTMAHARRAAEQRGEGVKSTEQFRKQAEECAERDKRDNKI